ncbi:MAG: hypothetical protein DELT_02416 [Desulfovibrio sp.]
MKEENSTQLRWFVGVPVVTNPIIALDVSIACIVVWMGATVVIAAAQHFVGSGLTYPALMAAVMYAAYLAGGMIAVFFIAGLFVLKNKYAALYRIDTKGVYVETMRATGVKSGLLHTRPFPIGPIQRYKSTDRVFLWKDITAYQPIDGMRALILKGKRGTLTKIYCPDEKTYQAAVTALNERVKAV